MPRAQNMVIKQIL